MPASERSESSESAARPTLREHLREGPFALAMSSGFFGFFAHAGLLTVLEDEGLLPSRVSGSSAGALVTAAWAAGVDAPLLASELERLQRRDFWDPAVGPGLLRGDLFLAMLARILPTRDLERGRVPAAVSVFELRARKTRVLSRGDAALAIRASCCFPFLFHPAVIDGRAYYDGGILDRPGLDGMPADEPRVLFHHLPSKSPWRVALEAPRRPGMTTLVLEGLPRSGPFRLDAGKRAFSEAVAAARRALDRPLTGDLVVVS